MHLVVLLMVVLASAPERAEVEDWLGAYVAGPETIAFVWEDGLSYRHGNIEIPVDGEWHVTVPEFYVRHRVSWIRERKAFRLEESHDDSPPWLHEFRLEDNRVVKVSLNGGSDGGEVVVRVFRKQDSDSQER